MEEIDAEKALFEFKCEKEKEIIRLKRAEERRTHEFHMEELAYKAKLINKKH